MFEFEVFRKQMHCIEESTCDIVWTFWRSRSHSALPVVIRRRGIMTPCPPRCAPATVLKPVGFVRFWKKMKELLWQTKISFLNFRPKLDDCMFKVFSWHCKCLHEYYSPTVLCYSIKQVSELQLLWQFMLKFIFLFSWCFRFLLYQKTF